MLSVSPQIAGVLHDTYRRMLGTPPDDHFQLYDYVSTTMAGIASVDAFYVGLFDGATKLRIPYCFDGQKYVMPGTTPSRPTAQPPGFSGSGVPTAGGRTTVEWSTQACPSATSAVYPPTR